MNHRQISIELCRNVYVSLTVITINLIHMRQFVLMNMLNSNVTIKISIELGDTVYYFFVLDSFYD